MHGSLLVTLLCCWIALPFAVLAENHAQPAEVSESAVDKAKVSRLERIRADLRRMTENLNGLRAAEVPQGGTAELILNIELADRRQRFRARVGDLANELQTLEKQGAADPETQRWLKELLRSDAPILVEEIKEQDARIFRNVDALMAEDEKKRQPAEHRLLFEVPEWDRLYQAWNANLVLREQLDLDVKDDRAALAERLDARGQWQSGVLRTLTLAKKLSAPKGEDQSDPLSSDVVTRLLALRTVFASSTQVTIALLDELNQPTVELREALITLTGTVSDGVLSPEVIRKLWDEGLVEARDWFQSAGPSLLFKLLILLLILFFARIAAGFTSRFVRHALDRSPVSTSNLLKEFFVKSARRLVFVLGFLIAIAQFGIEIGPLLAGLGIAGFVIGFALQDVLSNFASGMMILIYRPFDVGDFVEAGGVTGKVDDMTLVSTKILTVDNQLLFVPNNKIWGDVIRNVTHQATRRVDLVFGIGYSDDIDKAQRVLESVLAEHDLVLDDPEPVVKLHELGDSSVNFVVRPWVKTEDYWDVYWDLTREVKRQFDAQGLSIPFPQRDVHLYQAGQPAIGVDHVPGAEKEGPRRHTELSQVTEDPVLDGDD